MKMFTNLVITICFVGLINIFGSTIAVAHDKSHTKNSEHEKSIFNEGVDYCWEMNNYILNYTATFQLGFNQIGEGHYLVGGIGTAKSTTEPFEITRTAHGSAEIIDGKLVLTTSYTGIRNNVIGVDITLSRLDPVTLNGTFEQYGGYYDAVEISYGEILKIKCPHNKRNSN